MPPTFRRELMRISLIGLTESSFRLTWDGSGRKKEDRPTGRLRPRGGTNPSVRGIGAGVTARWPCPWRKKVEVRCPLARYPDWTTGVGLRFPELLFIKAFAKQGAGFERKLGGASLPRSSNNGLVVVPIRRVLPGPSRGVFRAWKGFTKKIGSAIKQLTSRPGAS